MHAANVQLFVWIFFLNAPYINQLVAYYPRLYNCREPGKLVGKSAELVMESSCVPMPAGAAREFSSPESILCSDFYSVSVPPPCYRSGM